MKNEFISYPITKIPKILVVKDRNNYYNITILLPCKLINLQLCNPVSLKLYNLVTL